MLDRVTTVLAVAGTLVATGQAASTWINGIYSERAAIVRSAQDLKMEEIKAKQQLELENLKGRQELAIEKVKNASELAKSYLDALFGQDRQSGDRTILLDALRQIEGHPLKEWAEDRYTREINQQKELQRLAESKAEASQELGEHEKERRELEVDVQQIRIKIEAEGGAPEKEKLRSDLTRTLVRLGTVKGLLKLSQIQVTAIQNLSSEKPLLQTLSIAETSAQVATIAAIADAVTPDLLKKVFRAGRYVETDYRYFQNAIKEFAISDPRMLAVILATLAIEAPTFNADYTEAEAYAKNSYEGRKDLGNVTLGDGVKFRGRGYIGLTGRENYEAMSRRLGLGTLLLDSPEEATKPEIAARIAVAFFVDRRLRIERNLNEGDLAGIRRTIVGGNVKVNEFKQKYEIVLAALLPSASEPEKE
ncbi:hypothetical protein [Agrobacterium sp. NPDC090283]|uniref:hypothetical protein n=1 Tax=Agrobacterium sp. NPDC090283 TaxID=3363920 RepID=UPI00383B8EC9